jgi:hypothetical protein
MGPQRSGKLLDLLSEITESDLGFLTEQRGARALTYRQHSTLYNQTPALELDYSQGLISPPFTPEDDDKLSENDVTAKRRGGASSRAVLETGALSTLDPPDGIGLYDVEHTLSLHTDEQTTDMAGWLLHLGTFDGMRYTSLALDLANPRVYAMVDDILQVDIGDTIRLTHLPDDLPPGDVDLIVQGYTEHIGEDAWRITFACVPGEPWSVAVVDDAVLGRVDTDGSVLAVAAGSTDAVLQVEVTAGPLWTTEPIEAPLDIRVGGEVMTVTAITGDVQDRFARTVTSGWGTADSGQAWTTTGGSVSDYSVQGV